MHPGPLIDYRQSTFYSTIKASHTEYPAELVKRMKPYPTLSR
uniref:Uncharacterized protein n=1 Tax=Arundo donax TaxID=35708 RepID=A0A0A9HGJ2_ARUDO